VRKSKASSLAFLIVDETLVVGDDDIIVLASESSDRASKELWESTTQ
jgi:hypothetical protein